MTPILSDTFAPPRIATNGASGSSSALPMTDSSLLDQQAGISGQIRRDTGGGSVRTVHRAERIGDIDLRHGGELPGKFGVIFLLTGVKAQVLQQQELARLQCSRLGLGVLADDVTWQR